MRVGKSTSGRLLLSIQEAAKSLNIGESTIRKLVYRRDIPFLKIGRRVLFDEDDLRAWLSRRKVRPS
jgi:excisionase family DNA binding protein